jgi:hypothetical protein
VKRPDALRALAVGAALVTIALTAVAFWLSYEHLHDVAHSNGLHDSARSWAWPATVDMFIVIGELLMLRASLRGRVDWWAIGLAASGSLGSIALNVAGVGMDASPMEYVVAAVPPVAALLAFGALMRQVHEALARATANPAAPAKRATPAPASAPAQPLPAEGASRVPAPASLPRQAPAKAPMAATPPAPTPAEDPAAAPASASDANTGRDLDEVAAAYRALRTSLGVRRPSSAKLGEALGVSRSRGQQLRDQLETHPDYRDEFAPALKSAG